MKKGTMAGKVSGAGAQVVPAAFTKKSPKGKVTATKQSGR